MRKILALVLMAGTSSLVEFNGVTKDSPGEHDAVAFCTSQFKDCTIHYTDGSRIEYRVESDERSIKATSTYWEPPKDE